jgi:hypothetical protein
LVHAQAQKFHLRGGHGIINVIVADADPDFAGSLVLGVPDCRDNAIVLQMFGKSSRVHKLPAPSRAAAATSATAGKPAASPIIVCPSASIKKYAAGSESPADDGQDDQQKDNHRAVV